MSHALTNIAEPIFKHNGERLLALLRQQHPEYHPILSIAKIAHQVETMEDGRALDMALRAHTTILKYIEPELKAMEVTIREKPNRTINVSLFEDAEIIPDSDTPREAIPDGQSEAAKITAMVIEGELLSEVEK